MIWLRGHVDPSTLWVSGMNEQVGTNDIPDLFVLTASVPRLVSLCSLRQFQHTTLETLVNKLVWCVINVPHSLQLTIQKKLFFFPC